MKQKLFFVFIFQPLMLLLSCSPTSANETEKKLQGKWKQTGGSGAIANLDATTAYEFKSGRQFILNAGIKEQVFRSIEGFYELKQDSIYFFYENNSPDAFYKARFQFENAGKLVFFDANGKLEFSRK